MSGFWRDHRSWRSAISWRGADDVPDPTPSHELPAFWPSIAVEVAWDAKAFEQPDTWSDITSDVLSFSTQRGRTTEFDAFPAGTCSATLDNSERAYDVDNAASPHVGKLRYNRQLRFRASWGGETYDIWRGYVDSWGPNEGDFGHEYTDLAISATDAFKLLSDHDVKVARPFTIADPVLGKVGGAPLAGVPTLHVESSGQRIRRILDLIGWPISRRRVDVGKTRLLADVPTDKVLPYCQRIEASEYGLLLMGADDAVEFHERHGISSTVQCVAADVDGVDDLGNAYLPYVGITYDQGGRSTLKNIVERGNGLHTVRRSNGESVDQYGPADDSHTDLLTADPEELDDQARAVLAAHIDPQPRVTSITFAPEHDEATIWPQILGRQIGERVAVIRTPVIGGPSVLQKYVIEGIAHDIDGANVTWRTTWQLSYAPDQPNRFTIGVSAIGSADPITY